MKPPFSPDKFLERCREFIPVKDCQVLSGLPETEKAGSLKTAGTTVKKWIDFDLRLRNELVKIRASRKNLEAAKYLRQDGFSGSAIVHLAQAAMRIPALLEAEDFLAQARWQALDELGFGHYFDLDFLIIYAYKLRILERLERIRTADKEALLENVITPQPS